MAFQDELTERRVEVVLRIRSETGSIDAVGAGSFSDPVLLPGREREAEVENHLPQGDHLLEDGALAAAVGSDIAAFSATPRNRRVSGPPRWPSASRSGGLGSNRTESPGKDVILAPLQ